MVAWVSFDGANYIPYARRYMSGSGWGAEIALDTVYANQISAACNAKGDAIVAWSSWNGSGYTAKVARYAADWGWIAAQTLSPMNGNTYTVSVAMDGPGNGYIFAQPWNGTGYQLRGAVLDSNGTLAATQRLDNSSSSIYELQVDASEATGAIAIWTSYNGTNYDIHSIRHNGVAWQSRLLVETKHGSGGRPYVGLDAQGNAMATWFQSVGGTYDWYATSCPTCGWGGAQYVGTSAYGSLEVLPSGQAVFVAYQWNGSAYVNYAFWYTPDRGFSAGVQGSDPVASYPMISADARGRVMVLYSAWTGSQYNMRAQFYEAGVWSGGAWVSRNGTTDYDYSFTGAMLADGRALVVWDSEDSGFTYDRITANIYSAPDKVAPIIWITSPFSGAIISSPYITLSGWTEPGAHVLLNGFPAEVYNTGYWQITLTLTKGNHWLAAQSTDAAGNTGYSGSLYVTYQDPQDLQAFERSQAGKSGWQDVASVEEVRLNGAWWPRVQADRYGNAFMVWYEDSYSGNHAYIARYQNGSGWSVPFELQQYEGQLWGAPRLSVDDGGNMSVIWGTQAWDGSWARVSAYFFTLAYGWTGPYRIDTGERYAWWPDVATNNRGNFYMVWQQRDEQTGNYSIWGRDLNVSGYYFGFHGRIETAVGSNDLPRVAYDGSGRAYVSFRNWNNSGTTYNLSLARYNGASWNGTQILQSVPGDQFYHALAADTGGNVTIATRSWNGSATNVSAGRFWANGSWSGNTVVWANSWDWEPEVIAEPGGRAFVASTATTSGSATAFVGVGQPGQPIGAGVQLEGTLTNEAGGPKLSIGRNGGPVRVHFDEYFGGMWHPEMREYNVANSTWGPVVQLSPGVQGGHIPEVAAMPDGGYMVAYIEDNTTLGIGQAVARRYGPFDTTAPSLTITTPTNGTIFGVPYTEIRGTTDVGSRVWVNNIEVMVASNGTFSTVVPLVNGSNVVAARASDLAGNLQNRTVTVTYNDPALAQIANLTAQNLALQAQLNAANSSLWAALAGQNASLLGQLAAQNASLAAAIAAGDASLLAQLIAQNSSLAAAIAAGDASLLAQLLAGDADLMSALLGQNDSLSAAITAGDAALLSQLLATNASLQALIDDVNSDLLASLAAQNASLLASIASTNASLLGKLAAQNASTAAALANLNATLLAQLAAQDADLTQLIADTNSSLLAELAAQSGALSDLIASTNMSLLASLAAQNGDLLSKIASTNATLLAQLAATNASLLAKLTADNNALWNSLNATNGVNANQNSTMQATQDDANAAQTAAASAGTTALMGLLLGLVGIAVAAMAILLSRKRPPPPVEASAPAPKVEGVEVVDVAPAPAAAPHDASHGHSMAAQGELGSGEA